MSTVVDETEALACVFKAASEPIRLRILAMLAQGELCVCHIQDALQTPQPTVSRHLGILRQADLVRARRAGSWVHYSLTEDAERWLAPALCTWRLDEQLRRDCRGTKGCA